MRRSHDVRCFSRRVVIPASTRQTQGRDTWDDRVADQPPQRSCLQYAVSTRKISTSSAVPDYWFMCDHPQKANINHSSSPLTSSPHFPTDQISPCTVLYKLRHRPSCFCSICYSCVPSVQPQWLLGSQTANAWREACPRSRRETCTLPAEVSNSRVRGFEVR